MELKTIFIPLLRWWWLLLLSIILALATSYWITGNQAPSYNARTTLIIGRTITNPNPSSGDFYLSQQLFSLYSNIAYTETVRLATMKALDLTWLPEYNVKPVGNSQFIEINVIDTDPMRAMRVAQELAKQLIAVSPSGNKTQDATRQAFIENQLSDIQNQIILTNSQISKKVSEIGSLQSAREIAQAQVDLQSLQAKLSLLQTNYANLLNNTQSDANNILNVFEPAALPTKPVGPSRWVIVALAGMMGLMVSSGASYLLEYFDGTFKTKKEVEQLLKLPVIGSFQILGRSTKNTLFINQNPRSPMAEAYRSMRAVLEMTRTERQLTTILITSPGSGDGKTTVAINLAFSFVQSGKKVILVDADIRKPSIHQYLALTNNDGLSEVLEGKLALTDALHKWTDIKLNDLIKGSVDLEEAVTTWGNDAKLWILTSGNPAEDVPDHLINFGKVEELIGQLKQWADVVIIDSSPFLISDPMILAARADGIIIVVRSGYTEKEETVEMVETIRQVDGKILGIAMNRMPAGSRKKYAGYYYSTKQKA